MEPIISDLSYGFSPPQCHANDGKIIVTEYRNYHDFVNWFVYAAKTINNHSTNYTIMEV